MFVRSKPPQPQFRVHQARSEGKSAPENLEAEPKTPPKRKWRKMLWLVAGLCWFYLAVVLAAWILMRSLGDRWWGATLILFGPRWVFATPLAVLVPLALWVRRRSLPLLLLTALLTGFLVMDFKVPWSRLTQGAGKGETLRVLTCNTHGKALNNAALKKVIAENKPDIVALQEWVHSNTAGVFTDGNWHIISEGELCLASRYPIHRVEGIGGHAWSWSGAAIRYRIDAPGGEFNFINLHFESPHLAFQSALRRNPKAPDQVTKNSKQRMWQAEQVRAVTESFGDSIMLAGDFNLPSDSSIYRQSLSGLQNAFSTSGWGFGWTYYARATVTRIDHILAGNGWRPLRCWVGPDVGSPHRPVIAELQRVEK